MGTQNPVYCHDQACEKSVCLTPQIYYSTVFVYHAKGLEKTLDSLYLLVVQDEELRTEFAGPSSSVDVPQKYGAQINLNNAD